MPCFDPLSMGYDWECWVSRETGERLDMSEIVRLADDARSELPQVKIGVDDELIENRSGPRTSFADLLEVTRKSMSVIRRVARRDHYLVWGCGAHPLNVGVAGMHIHVGSIYDHRDGLRLQAHVLKYVPVIGAILANAPMHAGTISLAKSERVYTSALGMTRPPSLGANDLWQYDWGADVNIRLPGKPTIEMRVGDSCFSERLVAEITTLAAAVAYVVGCNTDENTPLPTVDEYVTYIANRWQAGMYGLQATFLWDGEDCAVSDVITKVIEFAEPGLRELKCSADDLTTIRAMAAKRQTQADLLQWLMELHPDPYRYTMHLSNVLDSGDPLAEYLQSAPELPAIPRVCPEEMVRRAMQRESNLNPLWSYNRFPANAMADMLEKMERDGLITSRREMERATIYEMNDPDLSGRR